MSAKNRKKFLEGLAKAGVLKLPAFRRLYPKTKYITASIPGNATITIGDTTYKGTDSREIKRTHYAGDSVRITSDAADFSFSLFFAFGDGKDEVLLTVSGSISENCKEPTFLIPLPFPWAYSPPIADAFGLSTATRGVSFYPDCR